MRHEVRAGDSISRANDLNVLRRKYEYQCIKWAEYKDQKEIVFLCSNWPHRPRGQFRR